MITNIKSGDWVRFWKPASGGRRTFHLGYIEKVGEGEVSAAWVSKEGDTLRDSIPTEQVVEVLDYQLQVIPTPNLWGVGEPQEDFGRIPVETVLRGLDVPSKGYEVAYVSGYENARAIAALPNLLHALLDARDLLVAMQPWGAKELLEQVEDALALAGYYNTPPINNVGFHYQYTVGGDLMAKSTVILATPNILDLDFASTQMMVACNDGNKFNPEQVSIPTLRPEIGRDHYPVWHEFTGLSLTTKPVTDSRTLKEFMEQFVPCVWKEAVSP